MKLEACRPEASCKKALERSGVVCKSLLSPFPPISPGIPDLCAPHNMNRRKGEVTLQSAVRIKDEKPKFQLLFLKNNEDKVEVVESEEICVEEVKRHIELGGSIFIGQKPKRNPNSSVVKKKALEPWYVAHI